MKIKFFDWMIPTIESGEKTQTRLPIKGSPCFYGNDSLWWCQTGFFDSRGVLFKSPFGMTGQIIKITDDLSIEVINLRVERLHSLTEGDVFAEGCNVLPKTDMRPFVVFEKLWDSIYGCDETKKWDANPLVWVYEFEVVK